MSNHPIVFGVIFYAFNFIYYRHTTIYNTYTRFPLILKTQGQIFFHYKNKPPSTIRTQQHNISVFYWAFFHSTFIMITNDFFIPSPINLDIELLPHNNFAHHKKGSKALTNTINTNTESFTYTTAIHITHASNNTTWLNEFDRKQTWTTKRPPITTNNVKSSANCDFKHCAFVAHIETQLSRWPFVVTSFIFLPSPATKGKEQWGGGVRWWVKVIPLYVHFFFFFSPVALTYYAQSSAILHCRESTPCAVSGHRCPNQRRIDDDDDDDDDASVWTFLGVVAHSRVRSSGWEFVICDWKIYRGCS